MRTDDPDIGGDRAAAEPSGARLFSVRVWKEDLSGGSEYRGSVRDVRTDAFRGFRDWSDLVAFVVARVEQEESAREGRAKGGV